MGNRAVITTSRSKAVAYSGDIGVYLHWNGGRDSVEAFLTYCKLRGFRSPDKDSYGWARLCQVIGNFFGGDLSVGIDRCDKLDCDNHDNGVYIIEDWKIVGRQYFPYHPEQNEYPLEDLVVYIDERQPKEDRLGELIIRSRIKGLQEGGESNA